MVRSKGEREEEELKIGQRAGSQLIKWHPK
jgi:hypothetical protein